MTHSPPGRTLVHLVRFLLLLSLVIPQMPMVVLAAPAVAPPVAPPAAPLNQVACPAGPSGLPQMVDRTNFCVRYNQANTTLAQATQVADLTQQYWDTFVTTFGFRTPLFTGKLVVEVRNAACNGGTDVGVNWMFVNNGCFAPNGAMSQVTGHELFHRVQLAYGDDTSAGFWLFEGTARAMEDLADATLDNWVNAMTAAFSFNQQVNTYLNNTNVDITSFPQRYNSALWWKYFSEQFGTEPGEPELGVDAYRVLWETAETQDDIAAVNSTLGTLGAGTNFDAAFRRFVAANWVKDLSNQPDVSFNYTDEDQAGNPAPYGPINPANGGTINIGASATFNNQNISRYGARYYSATPGNDCPLISVSTNTDNGPAFYHVITESGTTLRSHVESSASPWTQSFFNDGITRVVVIAGATNNSAQSDITIQCLNPVVDIKIPNADAVAYVGPFDGPGKFLAQILVTNGDPKGPVVAGLTVNDFKARVNGVNALVTAGGFIQEQYWLVIQAPNQVSDGTYDLEIRLEESGTATTIASDTNTASVRYTPDNVDQVLVIDRSGSMASDSKMQAAKDAANFYVDVTRNNDGLAVVPFDHNVNPAPFNLQLVDLFVRTNAHNFINALSPGGATSIGDGMNEAVNQHNGSTTGNPLCSYVLLSDGMENSSLYWSDVAAAVQATNCPATTIAFGSAADETLMEQIATATGGTYFYNDVYVSSLSAANADASSAINTADTALDLASTYEYANALAEGRQRLLDERGSISPSATGGPVAEKEHRVMIDGSVKEALFALKWHQGGCQEFCPALALRLVAPDGKEYTEKSLPYTFKDTNSGHLGWRIPNPVPGQWQLFVGHADGSFSTVPVEYRVIVSADSLLTAHLLLPASRKLTGLRMPIFALVSSDGPIGDASVRAIVTSPDGTRTVVRLYDDGEHGDGNANDGLYSGVYERVNQANPVQPIREEGGEQLPKPRDEGSYRVKLLVNHEEFQREALGSFSVLEAPDTNENRIPDTYEEENGLTNPDGDNDLDWLDNYSEYLLGTNPNDSDTDDGGENDGSEVEKQKDPFEPKDDRIREPDFVDATADVNSIKIHFDVKEGYQQMILYRSESPNGPWQLRDQEVPPTGEYIDQEVKNGQPYWYKLMAVDGKNHRSAVVASQSATSSEDPFAPEAKIIINDSAPSTAELKVQLNFVPYEDEEFFNDIVEMKLGNSDDLSNVDWQPFEQEVMWELAEVPAGELTDVYGLFRDKAGNESLLETAMIRYTPLIVDPICMSFESTAGTVKFSEVPVELVRTAAQLLAEMRGGPMAPGWDNARFHELVRELYRPDIDGVAYYEFRVLNGDGGPAGFIIVSTGEHDHPIPHWNHEGETASQTVLCEAEKQDKEVAKFYKLDTLAYAGEDENGELAAMPGTQMVKVSGLTMDMLDKEQELSSSEWTPNKETQSDEDAGDIDGTLTKTGPTPPAELKIEGWESWQALKQGYTESYGVFIEALKREAAEDWETDSLAREFGEGLFKGQSYDFSLLIPGTPQVQMSGEGAGYIEYEIVSNEGQPAILRIHVKDAVAGKELPLVADVNYSSVNAANVSAAMRLQATQETLKFVVLDSANLPPSGETNQIFLPMINSGGESNISAASVQAINGSWSNWTYYWAGSHNDQRLYSQIPKNTAPNSSSCSSGCGGTAWAMLFGWADNQAANGNNYWAPRWGLYRQNGGTGANAVAPKYMDNGVRNMTWEIRNDVGTWCWGNSGPTNPWNMDNASNYFQNRTGTKLSTHYNVLGIHESRLRRYARNSIRDRNTPAIIGTGWLTHYPLAYGYAWRKRTVRKCFIFCWNETQYNRSFYVNQGWGGSGNGWVTASTWFAGEIRP